MPPRRPQPVHTLDEVNESELEQLFIARMEARLDQVVDKLTDQIQILVNERERQLLTPL